MGGSVPSTGNSMYKGMEAEGVVALEDIFMGHGGCSCAVKAAEGTKGQASQVCVLLQAPEPVMASCRRLRGTDAGGRDLQEATAMVPASNEEGSTSGLTVASLGVAWLCWTEWVEM